MCDRLTLAIVNVDDAFVLSLPQAADGAAANAAASTAHMDNFFKYAAYYFETEVSCIRSIRARCEAQKQKLAKDEVGWCAARFAAVVLTAFDFCLRC